MEKADKKRPAWVKDKTYADDFEVINVKPFNPYKDWVQDNGCYVLVRVYPDSNEIGVALCDYKHVILKEFKGKNAIELYFSIFKYDQENKKGWFTRMDHAAYLGKELKKAEISLQTDTEYSQE